MFFHFYWTYGKSHKSITSHHTISWNLDFYKDRGMKAKDENYLKMRNKCPVVRYTILYRRKFIKNKAEKKTKMAFFQIQSCLVLSCYDLNFNDFQCLSVLIQLRVVIILCCAKVKYAKPNIFKRYRVSVRPDLNFLFIYENIYPYMDIFEDVSFRKN